MIGISGYWYLTNYGAALTSYALGRQVQKLGYEVTFIDVPKFIFPTREDYRDDKSPSRSFIKKHFTTTEKFEDINELYGLNKNFDCFLLGSDQMWNWHNGRYCEEEGFYLFDYVDSRKKIISYATSFGDSGFKGNTVDEWAFEKLLKRFDAISVRERTGAETVKNLIGKDVEHVLDPVFFLSKDEYKKVAALSSFKDNICEKYIFVYLLQPTEDKQQIVKEISEYFGLRVISLGDLDAGYVNYCGTSNWNMPHIDKVEIEDWLYLIDNAEYVVTDSYHGCCFSVIFNKKYMALTPRDGINRIIDMADTLQVVDRALFLNKRDPITLIRSDIEYDGINKTIEQLSAKSINWLKKSLTMDKNKADNDIIIELIPTKKKIEDFEDAILFLREQTEQIWQRYGKLQKQFLQLRKVTIRKYLLGRLRGKKVSIRGAGVHTSELMKLVGDDLRIECIYDPNVSISVFKDTNIPIVNTIAELQKYKVDVILISSFKYRNDMKADMENLMGDIEIVDMYEELRAQGVDIDTEFYIF